MSTKISQLTSATDVTANDLIQIVDVEDGVMAPSGTNKKATASLLAKELAKQPLEPGVVISGSSSGDAVRITQTGSGNALVVEDSTNPDSTPTVITASGNVGIGTNSPADKLEVNGNMVCRDSTQFGGFALKNASNTIGYMIGTTTTNDGGQIGLLDGNIEKVIIKANGNSILNGGNVGIGTNGPSHKLDIVGSGVSITDARLRISNPNTSNFSSSILDLSANGVSRVQLIGQQDGATNGGQAIIQTANNSGVITERMVITSSGNVGIGTSSPTVKLDVNGRIKGIEELSVNYPPGTSKYLALQSNGVIRWGVGSGSETETGSNVGSQFFINRHTDDGAYIDTAISIKRNNGNVGIGTQNPSYQFELSTDSAAKPSTSTWTISSDERLKENIEAADLDICYNAVKNIPLKRYKWKDEIYSAEQVADRSKIGWIAQDVQAVFPKAVNEHKFVYNQVKDEDGNIVSEDVIEDCLSLNSDQIYAALFGAVQKLMGEVESLQGRIAELEAAP